MEEHLFSEMIQIGKVDLNLKYYSGVDEYSDGYIEDVILVACKEHKEEELLSKSTEWPVLYHLSPIRENLLEWYPINKSQRVLEIGSGCGAITGVLSQKAKEVTCIDLSKKRTMINAYRHMECDNIKMIVGNFQDIESELGMYDVITLIGVLEYAALYISEEQEPFIRMLELISKHLNKNGIVIIAIENKMGLKYWNGASEDHTGEQYSGLDDYVDNERIRTFSKSEIEEMLVEVGLDSYKFYYPMPDYKLPTEIYSDEKKPQAGELRTFKKEYSKTRFYNFYDDTINDQICRDKMFNYFANSFLVFAGNSVSKSASYVKYNRERKKEYRIATIVDLTKKEERVMKYPLDSLAFEHINNLKLNEEKWRGIMPKIRSAKGKIVNGCYVSEYVDGVSLDIEFYKDRNNLNDFVEKARYIIETYFKPNENEMFDFYLTDEYVKVFGENIIEGAKSTKTTNIDIIFSNLKRLNGGDLMAFDFEWVFYFPIPNEYVIWRAINNLYIQYQVYLKNHIQKKDFVKVLGIDEKKHQIFERMEKCFGDYVSGIERCEVHTKRYERPAIMQSCKIW